MIDQAPDGYGRQSREPLLLLEDAERQLDERDLAKRAFAPPEVHLDRAEEEVLPPFHLDDPTRLQGREPPPRKWIVENYIPDRAVTLFTGDSGIGKTLALLQLAASIASTGLWLGLPTKRCKVWMITAEDDFDELHRRLRDVSRDIAVELTHLEDLRIRSMAGEDSLLAYPMEKGRVRPTPLWQSIQAKIAEERPGVAIFEPVADLFAGNENDRTETKQFTNIFTQACQEFDMGMLKAAHPSRAGLASGTGESGSTGWKASVRSMFYMRKDGDEGSDPNARVIEHKKANYGPLQPDIKVRWHDGAFTVAHKTDESQALGQPTKAERVFLDLLRIHNEQGRWVRASQGHGYAPKAFEGHPRSEGILKRAFAAAMERLLDTGAIVSEEYGYASNRKRRLAIAEAAR